MAKKKEADIMEIWFFGLFFRNTAFLAPCGMHIQRRLRSLVLRKKHRRKMIWGSGWVSRILCQISLEVRLYVCAYFPCLAKKTSPKNDLRFRAEFPEYGVKFRSEYRQYAIAHFPCFAKKHRRKMIWGSGLSLPNTASNFARSTDSTPSLIFLVLRKNPSKIETLGLFGDTASNFTRSTFARCHSFSLSYEKILQKSRFWVFSEILRQISLGVHSYAVVHFPTERPSV